MADEPGRPKLPQLGPPGGYAAELPRRLFDEILGGSSEQAALFEAWVSSEFMLRPDATFSRVREAPLAPPARDDQDAKERALAELGAALGQLDGQQQREARVFIAQLIQDLKAWDSERAARHERARLAYYSKQGAVDSAVIRLACAIEGAFRSTEAGADLTTAAAAAKIEVYPHHGEVERLAVEHIEAAIVDWPKKKRRWARIGPLVKAMFGSRPTNEALSTAWKRWCKGVGRVP